MKTEIVIITPQLARSMLEKNTRNRPVRNSHVETLRASFERGEYRMTHQGIAFDSNGELIDGQHRLHAIALLADGEFPMLVTTGLPPSVFAAVDATLAKRTVSDALGEDSRVAQVGVMLSKLYKATGRGAITPGEAAPFIAYAKPEALALVAFCPTTVKVWSAAPVKAAAVMAVKMRPNSQDHVFATYRALVLANFDEMPSVAKGMFRSQLNGRLASSAWLDMFLRCLKMFDIKQRNLTLVKIINADAEATAVRDFMASDLPWAMKKKAPARAEAKSVSRANSTAHIQPRNEFLGDSVQH